MSIDASSKVPLPHATHSKAASRHTFLSPSQSLADSRALVPAAPTHPRHTISSHIAPPDGFRIKHLAGQARPMRRCQNMITRDCVTHPLRPAILFRGRAQPETTDPWGRWRARKHRKRQAMVLHEAVQDRRQFNAGAQLFPSRPLCSPPTRTSSPATRKSRSTANRATFRSLGSSK